MIIKKDSTTCEQKLNDLLNHTDEVNSCLEWKGCFNTDGYARMGGNIKVHRLVYSLVHQIDITGRVIRHTCDNIKCINPKHLLSGTHRDNMNDRNERDRVPKIITRAIIIRIKELLSSKILSQKEIAKLIGINPKRISDIHRNKYCSATGKFLGHG